MKAIDPFLEATTAGISTQWAKGIAKELSCFVTVGYPEVTVLKPTKQYNSTVTVAPDGRIVANYRKSHLYYTDETWASEGKPACSTKKISELGLVAFGICMDINPYRFTAPWDKYEFASNALAAKTPIIAVSMAWLTRLSEEELMDNPKQPDMDTVTYWIERFSPFLRSRSESPTTVICANRCGHEGPVWYAGSSIIFSIQDGKVRVRGAVGRYEEKCFIVEIEL